MLAQAIHEEPWEVIMLAYSLMNQGARRKIFPVTERRGIGTLLMFVVRNIFSNAAYRRDVFAKLVEQGHLDPSILSDGDPLDFLVAEGGAESITDAAYRYARHEQGADVILFGTGNKAHVEAERRLDPPPASAGADRRAASRLVRSPDRRRARSARPGQGVMRKPSRRTVLAGVAAALASPPILAQGAARQKIAAALPRIDAFARQIVDRKLVPGLSMAVVHQDEVVYLQGFGVRQIGMPEPVEVDTVFQLASVSKPIASTVVSALVSEGKVSWDSRIRDIDPGFALQDELATAALTVGDLFAHRSGLPGHVGDDIEDLGFSQGDILRRLRLAKPAYSFRNGYSYSNFGLTEGAVAAARFAGMGWEEAAEEKLYKPLGMKSTSSRYRDFMSRPNRAALHVPVDGSWASFTRRDADAQSPAGGASSNARDMAQWLRLLLADGRFRRAAADRQGSAPSRRMFPPSCAASTRPPAPPPSMASAGTSTTASTASN